MKEQAGGGQLCPPHHWEVTLERRDRESWNHHVCMRCGAQKDQPILPFDGKKHYARGAAKK